MPLLAIIHLQSFGFILHAGFLAIPFLFFNKLAFKSLKFDFFEIWLVLSAVTGAVLLMRGLPLSVYIPQVIPTAIPPVLIILYKIFNVPAKKLDELITKTLKVSFYIGSAYFIAEWLLIQKLQLIPLCDFSTWFNGHEVDQYCAPGRSMMIGFLIFKDIGFAYLMGCYFSLEKDSVKKQLANFVLIFFTLVITDSITLIAIFFLILVVQNTRLIRKHFHYAFFAFLCMVAVFFHTSTFMRIMSYLTLELNLTNYLPVSVTCESLLFSLNGINSSCNSNEVHSLFYLYKFGILPTLGWYFSFLMSCYYFVKFKLTRIDNRLLYFNLVFVMNALHYSGAESWGINFIFVTILYLAHIKLQADEQAEQKTKREEL